MVRRRILLCLACVLSPAGAATAQADRAVATLLRHEAPAVRRALVLQRLPTGAGDFVLVLGTQSASPTSGRTFGWTTADRLGLFLQDRATPGRIYRIAVAAGPNPDCYASVVRLTPQDLVLSCVGEKWTTYENQKFVFDLRAKALVARFSYRPFGVARILSGAEGPRFVMSDAERLLLVDLDPETRHPRVSPAERARQELSKIPLEDFTAGSQVFRKPAPLPDQDSIFGTAKQFHLALRQNKYGSDYLVIVEHRGSRESVYSLPQSTAPFWREARPDEAGNLLHLDPAEMGEQLGPHQLEGNRLWFGKTFYNGEGLTGVGGFGYFDEDSRSFRLFSPPEIRRWSVSAILVESDSVWLALEHRGEYGNTPGGLLRWDRKTEDVTRFDVDALVTAIARDGEAIYLGATDRLLVLRGGSLESYFVDRAATGRYRVARAGIIP